MQFLVPSKNHEKNHILIQVKILCAALLLLNQFCLKQCVSSDHRPMFALSVGLRAWMVDGFFLPLYTSHGESVMQQEMFLPSQINLFFFFVFFSNFHLLVSYFMPLVGLFSGGIIETSTGKGWQWCHRMHISWAPLLLIIQSCRFLSIMDNGS